MHSWLEEKIIYPLGDMMMGTSVMRYYRWLQKTQWWSPEQLRELQNRRLSALIKHAYENVPYYRRVFDERGLTVKDVRTIDDLSKLPILTKNDIRQNFESIRARDYRKWKPVLNYTGGSTGEPLKFYITKDEASINWAGIFRGWGWAGYRIGDKRATVGGSSMIILTSLDLKKRARLFLERNLPISTLNMNDSQMRLHINKLLRHNPKFIYGYAGAIYLIAEYLIKHRIENIHPKAIFTTAEMCLPRYRTTIEQAFQCAVLDCYGSYDGAPQAIECPSHQGYHISSEKAVMEFLGEDEKAVNPGQCGEIISTDLYNYAMPFIRYKVGDMGAPANGVCKCGRGLPLVRSVEGRSLDFIQLPNGTRIRGLRVIDIFYEYLDGSKLKELTTIRQFQIVQNKRDQLLVRIQQDLPGTSDETAFIKAELFKVLSCDMNIELEYVDEIADSANGKRKYIISNV